MKVQHLSIASTMRKRASGFTLVEVLIALVIMSIGMLGIAGLYVHSMQAGRTALFRHNAITLAGDVAERIRANPRAGVAYAAGGANNNCVGGGINCTAPQMAANDVFLWDLQATASLPNGAVAVGFADPSPGVTPPMYTITVSWTEPGEVLDYTIAIPVFGI
jgi:type IV pilus assembly protein PilV